MIWFLPAFKIIQNTKYSTVIIYHTTIKLKKAVCDTMPETKGIINDLREATAATFSFNLDRVSGHLQTSWTPSLFKEKNYCTFNAAATFNENEYYSKFTPVSDCAISVSTGLSYQVKR